jgi:hypothetical protein
MEIKWKFKGKSKGDLSKGRKHDGFVIAGQGITGIFLGHAKGMMASFRRQRGYYVGFLGDTWAHAGFSLLL